MGIKSCEKSNISVIIPAFNRAHTLPLPIESLINQSNKNWELIIIDDGSIDNTKSVIQEYIKDDRIKYFYQEHQGVSAARNFGVTKACGDYIIFLDSDDNFEINLIDQLHKQQFFKYDIICWEVLRISEKGSKIGKPIRLDGLYNYIFANFLAGCICYKKDVFVRAGGYDPQISFGENYELGIRIGWMNNLRFKNINFPFLNYNLKTSQRSSNSIENRISSYVYQLNKHKLLYSENIRAKAKMEYLIGFVFEEGNFYEKAIAYYKKSWCSFPLNIKPLLKILYFKIFY